MPSDAPRLDGVRLVIAIALISSTVAVTFGHPFWFFLVACAAAWVRPVARRFNDLTAGTLAIVGSLALVMASETLSAVLHLPVLSTYLVAGLLLGILGLLSDHRIPPREDPHRDLVAATWLPALLGPAVWTVTLVIAQGLPGASTVGWALEGDAANNLLFARRVLAEDGVVLAPGSNPVPLPSAMLALGMSAGRGSLPPEQWTAHDFSAFASTWAFLIAVCCVLSGVAVAVMVRTVTAKHGVIAVAGGAASLLPLSWFFSGLALESGYFNTHLALILCLAAWMAALTGRRHPVVAVSVLGVITTLLLTVWSPLAGLPVALGLATMAMHHRPLRGSRGIRMIVVVIALGQVVLYAALVVLPSIAVNLEALSGNGGVFRFHRALFPAAALATILTAALAYRRRAGDTSVLAAAATGGLGIGFIAVLGISGALSGQDWGYYPHKFAWLASSVLLILTLGAALTALATWKKITGPGFAATVVALTCLSFWGPTIVPGASGATAVSYVLDDADMTDTMTDTIAQLSDGQHPRVLWQSEHPGEQTVNYWLLQLWAGSPSERPIRTLAYQYLVSASPADLCSIAETIGGPLEVRTAHPEAALAETEGCHVSVSVEAIG